MGKKPFRMRERLISVGDTLRRWIGDILQWLLIVPLVVLALYALAIVFYGLIYWELTSLSKETPSIQNVASRLRDSFSGEQVLVAVLGGFAGLALERWRKATEARRRSALQELEQLRSALDQKHYGEAVALYRLFQARCGTTGIWRDLDVWNDVRSIWERKASAPLRDWVRLIEGSLQPEPTPITLEALTWGCHLDPRNWEKQGRALIEQLVTHDNLEPLVNLFARAPEARKLLLRLDIIGQRLKELREKEPKKAVSGDWQKHLETLQSWRQLPPPKMPLPWERVSRPPEPPGFAKWLQEQGFRENPFGPEMAELDPSLSDYGYWPPFLEGARGPRPALVIGAPGSGRTAAALLLYQKCLHPTGNPEEEGVFPIRLEVDTWPQNPEGWLERIGRALAEALLQVCGRDPYALFVAREISAASAHLFVRYFGPATSVAAHLRRQGLAGSAIDYVLGSVEFYADGLSKKKIEDAETLWDLIAKARPPDLRATYLILDVPWFRVSGADSRISSLRALMEMVGHLAYRSVFLKLFLPEEAGERLRDAWPLPPVFLKEWPEKDLHAMLQKRLSQTSGGRVEGLLPICAAADFPPDPDTWLVRSAEGSPRRLVELGNEMLRKTWEKSLRNE